MSSFHNIPTNIISGFLGAGKTTAIQYLIAHKPVSETWAIVVNEFGQIGVDGKLLKNNDVAVKEIPGGCLCCVASQSFSVGLNQIIKQYKPHRIIIEPTGLGHPKKLIETLTSSYYESVLDLRAVINLVDARNLSESKYLEHDTFVDQIKMADILLASKLDQYQEKDRQVFYNYVYQLTQQTNMPKAHIAMIQQGELKLEWLNIKHDLLRTASFSKSHNSHESHGHAVNFSNDINYTGWQVVEGHTDGYSSLSWHLDKSISFNADNLVRWLNDIRTELSIDRIKGVLRHSNDWFAINMTEHESDISNIEPSATNIIEMISSSELNAHQLDDQLRLHCDNSRVRS